jgi:mono/diheme cytochrome c family protein
MSPRHLFCVVCLLPLAGAAVAADLSEGKSLVTENCYSCHGDELYTRADRKVQSLPGLHKQVKRCELALGLRWFDDQVDNAAAYLNDRFYHFK